MKRSQQNNTQKTTESGRGLTLVEIIISVSVAALVMGGVLAVVISLARTAVKNERVERTATSARQIQEMLTQELNSAINVFNDNAVLRNRPTFADSNGGTPPRFRQINYRSPVGPPGNIPAAVSTSTKSLTFNAPAELRPQVGDFLILDTPQLGRGIRIITVSDARAANASGNVTITFAQTLAEAAIVSSADEDVTTVPANSRVEIQRERSFTVIPPATGSLTTSLLWSENTASGVTQTLTDRLAASESYLFSRVPDDEASSESAVGWYLVLFDSSSTIGLPGRPIFFSSASIGGSTSAASTSLIMPKSGNSLALSNPFAAESSSISTTSLVSSSSSSSTTTTTTSKATTLRSTTLRTTLRSTTLRTTLRSTTLRTTLQTTLRSTTLQTTLKSTLKSSVTTVRPDF